MKPIAVVATGMVSGVGFDAPSNCAAIRCAIDNFQETRFIDRQGEWIIASEVPLDPPSRGRSKLVRMAALAISECLPGLGATPVEQVPLVVSLAEAERPGRFQGLDSSILEAIAQELGFQFSNQSGVIKNGTVGGVQALDFAARMILEQTASHVLVVGVDTYLVAATLMHLDDNYRLLTPANSNGFIPGEAAAAVLLRAAAPSPTSLEFVLQGFGYGREPATLSSEEPFKADGMSATIMQALQHAGCSYDDVDYRMTDISGEQYAFKEASLAAARTMKKVKPEFDLWHPADCIGEVGAAMVPCMLTVATAAAKKEYAPGDGVLFHCANDDEQRAAFVGRYMNAEKQHG
ncbi:MAG: hypothetical protein NXI32_20310 [bacterium]|nr:hypothetical protein [bacterium]